MALSSDDYIESLLIPYEGIASATNNFAIENLIAEEEEGSSGQLYKGQLILLSSGQLIDVVALKFQNYDVVVKEMLLSYVLQKKIFAFVVGMCIEDKDQLVMVKKHMVNGSLDKHLSTLTWLQRLQICVGVSHALSCLHFSNEKIYMIHGDIKSSKILLDHNCWVLSFLCQLKDTVFTLPPNIQPRYSIWTRHMKPPEGLLISQTCSPLELFCLNSCLARKQKLQMTDNWYFARLARLRYEEKKLDELIHPDLRKQMNLEAFNLFSETAYFCLKEERKQRPDFKLVVKRLERALEIQNKHESAEQSTVSVETTPSSHFKGKNLDYLRIPLSDIKLATNNFSETYCIGSGGYGKVYKAELNHLDDRNSSTTVAIKRIFSREDKQGEEGFLAEIEMLVNCKHPNVISLLGFCDEDREMLLIYEYASKGSLEDYFGNNYNITTLTWTQRIQICLNIAHGLEYLHTSTVDKRKIIHCDIKSANILLDDKWMAKIADFGLSKLHDVNQHGSTLMTCTIARTQLYLDPEYWNTGKLKRASDIYSFGVVMSEILCGKLAYDRIYGEKGLPLIVRERFHDGTLKEIVDPKLIEADEITLALNQGSHQDSLDTFSRVAHQCLAETQVERPTIEAIIKELEKALDVQKSLNVSLQISLEDIKLTTGDFSDYKCIDKGVL